MNKIKYLLLLIPFFLVGCASTAKEPKGYEYDKVGASLAEASYNVSRSISSLAETAQAAHPLPDVEAPPAPASYGMGGVTTVDWSGPVEPLLKQIAASSDYRFHTLGTPPAIPVIVTINAKNVMLGDVLRDVGYQCGRRAAVLVFPANRLIELRYAKN